MVNLNSYRVSVFLLVIYLLLVVIGTGYHSLIFDASASIPSVVGFIAAALAKGLVGGVLAWLVARRETLLAFCLNVALIVVITSHVIGLLLPF